MSRTIPSSILAALGNPEIEPFYAIDLDFATVSGGTDVNGNAYTYGPLRLWTGYGNKTIGAYSYIGSGNMLNVSGLEEANDLSAKGATISLSGISSDVVSYAIKASYQGRLVTIYWGINGVSDVIEVFSGYMDKMTIQDEGATSNISLSVESRLIALDRAKVRRYTHESHKAVIDTEGYSQTTDTFFKWVTRLQDKQIVWGREVNNPDDAS